MSDLLNYVQNCDHLGRLMMHIFREQPENICQIDAATGQKETNASVLSRSIKLAKCFRKFGLQAGDVLSLSGKNHLDIHIPFYAALLNALPIVGVDPIFKFDEIKALLKITEPKIAFCESKLYGAYVEAVKDLGLKLKVVTFDAGDNSLQRFLEDYTDEGLEEFEPASFDGDKIYAWLVSTSGTTGRPKVAAFKHETCIQKLTNLLRMSQGANTRDPRAALNFAPVQWISAYVNAVLMPVANLIKVQTSAALTPDHVIDVINEYRPVSVLTSPALLSSVVDHEKYCDFSCFDNIIVTGCKVKADIIIELRKRVRKDAVVAEAYGMTEFIGPVLWPNPYAPIGCSGRPMPTCSIKLVNTDTEEEILKPYEHGVMWCKGVRFTEYYRNPEETRKAITEDGWYKTGDIFYKDENNNFYFVDRLKMLIKYRNYHVIPVEIEDIIRTHPNVADVCVTSVLHTQDGEHPVACIVQKRGCDVTVEEIKDLVASKLSESKHLRGGVVFMDELPYTTTGKLARAKLKSLVADHLNQSQLENSLP